MNIEKVTGPSSFFVLNHSDNYWYSLTPYYIYIYIYIYIGIKLRIKLMVFHFLFIMLCQVLTSYFALTAYLEIFTAKLFFSNGQVFLHGQAFSLIIVLTSQSLGHLTCNVRQSSY